MTFRANVIMADYMTKFGCSKKVIHLKFSLFLCMLNKRSISPRCFHFLKFYKGIFGGDVLTLSSEMLARSNAILLINMRWILVYIVRIMCYIAKYAFLNNDHSVNIPLVKLKKIIRINYLIDVFIFSKHTTPLHSYIFFLLASLHFHQRHPLSFSYNNMNRQCNT